MSLSYDTILKELDEKVREQWDLTCKESNISPDDEDIDLEIIENNKHYAQFNTGVNLLIKAMSEYRFMRYMYHFTVDDITTYINSTRIEQK
jgi:hypothetical protein